MDWDIPFYNGLKTEYMKRNKKNQPRGLSLDGKTNQYVKRNDNIEDLPKSHQHPLGDARSIAEDLDIEQDRINHKSQDNPQDNL